MAVKTLRQSLRMELQLPGTLGLMLRTQQAERDFSFGIQALVSGSSFGILVLFELCKQDILESSRVASRNCTDGEPLAKRNEEIKAAFATKGLEGLSRYAKDYQEKQGYFEEGMQLVYHYGDKESKKDGAAKGGPGSRYKRAHRGNDTDVSNFL